MAPGTIRRARNDGVKSPNAKSESKGKGNRSHPSREILFNEWLGAGDDSDDWQMKIEKTGSRNVRNETA